jgi:SAM-dependent methyltransferase
MNDTQVDDVERLRREYGRRAREIDEAYYSPFDRANLFILQQRQRSLLDLLRRQGCSSLAGKQLLEVGCGGGGVLLEYLGLGAAPAGLHGTDLLLPRVAAAKSRLPHLPLTCADGRFLPYPRHSFDLVLQYTVFSSILDPALKQQLAQEMVRVLRPGGLIIWYDFWFNPTNRQTQGIRPAEIRRLFPHCTHTFYRLTLAPPLARRLVPLSWTLALLLEKLRLFNSHYLVAVRSR